MTFKVYNLLKFSGQPDLSAYGLSSCEITSAELWPSGSDYTEPDLDHINHNVVPALRQSSADVNVVNIEHWSTAGPDHEAVRTSVSKLTEIIRLLRRKVPNMIHGYYGLLPRREYSGPMDGIDTKLQPWYDDNDRLASLGFHDQVDAVFPSLYTFYGWRDWIDYAVFNIAEARRYGKPVIPFLWPQYHGSGQTPYQLIDGYYWRRQLEIVYRHADSVVLWGPPSSNDPGWDDNAEWWQETLSFMQSL